MGADIYGWVEIRPVGDDCWYAATRIHDIVGPEYGIFAGLFGMHNGVHSAPREGGRFRAIAYQRGEPPRASKWYLIERDNYGGAVSETWLLWSELAVVDWNEEGTLYVSDALPHVLSATPGPGKRLERRGDHLAADWATLFKLMAVLAEQWGADNVRLSVWFA